MVNARTEIAPVDDPVGTSLAARLHGTFISERTAGARYGDRLLA